MAKLEGVKVIDMVDGEVTKIEYKGNQYAFQELKFDDQKEGDIVLNTTETLDATLGGYYQVCSDGIVYDDVRVPHSNIQYEGRVFRKVAKPDGNKIYPKPAQVGDVIKIVDAARANKNGGDYDDGDIMTVLEVDSSGWVDKTDKYDGTIGEWEFVIIGRDCEKSLELGDYVAAKPSADSVYLRTNTDMIYGKVIDIYGDNIEIKIMAHKNEDYEGEQYHVGRKYFRRLSEEELSEIKGKSIVGKYVEVVAGDNGIYWGYAGWGKAGQGLVKLGSVGKVVECHDGGDITVYFDGKVLRRTKFNPDGKFFLRKGEYKVVGDTEAKDGLTAIEKSYLRANREIGELKEGDIVRIHGDNVDLSRNMDEDIGVVVKVDPDETVKVHVPARSSKYRGYYHGTKNSVELIAPASARVDTDA